GLCLFSASSSAIHWAHILTGEVAARALLWAAVQGAVEQSSSSQLRRAADWARLQFEEAASRALTNGPAETAMLDAGGITNLVYDYTEAIGDIEQTLAGEDYELDSMLRRDLTEERDRSRARVEKPIPVEQSEQAKESQDRIKLAAPEVSINNIK